MRPTSRRLVPRFVAGVVFAFSILALAPRAAFAHAVLVRSTPTANSAIDAGDHTVRLTFNSRVDAVRSTLSLLRPDGKVVKLAAIADSPEILSAKTGVLAKGAYMLRWQALSSDGHITRGEVPFRVR